MSTRTVGDGITNALRETADALGRLLAGHLKLARLELFGDASDVARRAAAAAAFATLAAIGYVFVVLGLAALLEPALAGPAPCRRSVRCTCSGAGSAR